MTYESSSPGTGLGFWEGLKRLLSAGSFGVSAPGEPRYRHADLSTLRVGDGFVDRVDRQVVARMAPRVDGLLSDKLLDHHFIALASRGSELWPMLRWLNNQPVRELKRIDDPQQLIGATPPPSAGPSMAIIDLDQFQIEVDAITKLMFYRRLNPTVPVIIASKTFARHEFTGERWAIADACLKLPVTSVTFALAIGAAETNRRARRLT
jgi:hypothetical protein